MGIKNIIGAIGMCMSLLSFSAIAIPTYDITAGDITGVSGLEIDGDQWDMMLHDATFNQNSFLTGTIDAYTTDFASDATVALATFIMANAVGPANSFLGCSDALQCNILTNLGFSGPPETPETIVGWSVDYIDPTLTFIDFHEVNSTNQLSFTTFASWKLAASSVPEPSVVLLIASGLIAFGIVRRKGRA